MISASHNPFYDNGIKVINGAGMKLEADIEAKIEEYIDGISPEIPFATKENIGKTVDFAAGRNRYIGYLISLATRSFKDKTIALDCSNGSASSIAKNVFDALGAKTLVINNEPDGTNINTNCGSTHIDVLAEFVKNHKVDAGFAYDGDADRCIAVDENGTVIDGDGIMYVCGTYMKECGQLSHDTVVTTVMSNIGLYRALEAKGIRTEQTAVGDKYVCENMMTNGHCLGGEQSGHIIFSKHATTGDGILTSLKMMEAMLEKKQPLSYLTRELRIFPQLLVNVKVQDKNVAMQDADVLAAADEVSRKLEGNGRILLRPSGTENLVRVMVEAETDEICKEMAELVVNKLKKYEV
jgi:phosphoglucosamine mutase